MDILLPEITAVNLENFNRRWTRFFLVAAAKEWNTDKQLLVIPTLLHGKLLEYYIIL